MSRALDDTKARPARRSKKARAQPVPEKDDGNWFERLKRLRLSFRRKGIDVQVLLEDPVEKQAEIKRAAAAAQRSEAASLSTALKAVLDTHSSSRGVLVHLVFLEKALKRRGLKALQELPPDLLRRATFQLETLVSDWSSAPLAALRGKLMAELIKHDGLKDKRSSAQLLSDFHDDKRLQSGEVSMTTFLEANEQWERSLTGG